MLVVSWKRERRVRREGTGEQSPALFFCCAQSSIPIE
jgi:hypothetical protein